MVMRFLFLLCAVRDGACLFAYSSMLREWSTLRLADTMLILNVLHLGVYPTRDRFIFIGTVVYLSWTVVQVMKRESVAKIRATSNLLVLVKIWC